MCCWKVACATHAHTLWLGMMETEMNTHTRTVSVHSTVFDRQANNLELDGLSEAVKPWFDDVLDPTVAQAIEDLGVPEARGAAARFLGLELTPVA